MNQEQLNAVVVETTKEIASTLTRKGEEYADADGDRLDNFKQLANLQHSTPERALLGLVGKHIVALFDFARRDAQGDDPEIPNEQWEEKTGEIIAYMVLLRALLAERKM
jgi:hypothetical protein